MIFNMDRSALVNGLNVVSKAISNRTPIGVLENIYIYLNESAMVLRGNDMDLAIETQLNVTQEVFTQPTGILVKSDTFIDIVSKLNSPTVQFELGDDHKLHIRSDSVDFDIFGLSTDEYPDFPDVDCQVAFDVDAKTLRDLIRHTIFSVSTDDSKRFLNGVKIESDGCRCDFISTDGVRLSLKHVVFEAPLPEFSCTVPYKTMNELMKVLASDGIETIRIQLSSRQISFKVGPSLMMSRLVGGHFPDHRPAIPKHVSWEYHVSRQALMNAIDRAGIIAAHSNFVASFQFLDDVLTVVSNSAKMGEYSEKIDVDRRTGEGCVTASFQIKFLQEVLKIINQSMISISLTGAETASVIRPVGDDTYTHIAMPIRMSDYLASKQPVAAVANP